MPETISLDDISTRIKATDLIPSRVVLLTDIDVVFSKLMQHGIHTLLDLQKSIKNPKLMETLSKTTGIDLQYLVLLKREVESYIPKPFHLDEIDWVPAQVIEKLAAYGIINSEQFYASCSDSGALASLAEKTGVDHEATEYLANLVSLCRVQWVSPNTGRMLIEAGYDNCQKLSSAEANDLFSAMDRVNENGKYFKGTIGLRDIKRLIEAAKYSL
jgi:hypothetical protein